MTADDAATILGKANLWAAELQQRGQVDDAAAARLNETLAESFGERLDHQDDPLLVVMLCGPTAVGKSSLINALAGAEIARPGLGATTRAAMLYVHERDDPARLFEYSHVSGHSDQPETELVRHHRDELLHKVLVDTPDIDSVRLEHEELTARLVHAADLVLFVTSPEKYKVMRSARWVLQQRQQRAMAFVLNKWDRETLGLQRERRSELMQDFRHVLADEGYPDALIFKVSALGTSAGNPDPMDAENELPALRSWLETGISQSTAATIRQRRLRSAWGRLAAAIRNVAPRPLSEHPFLPEITSRLAAAGDTVEQRVNAEAAILEPAGLEDAGWPATPGLLGMWARTRHHVASTTASLRGGLSVFRLSTRPVPLSYELPYQSLPGLTFGASGAAVLLESVAQFVREAALARVALGPVEAAWTEETTRLERQLARLPLDVTTELMTSANRLTIRRSAGIASIYAIEGMIILVLLVAVVRIGLDFVAGSYAPGSLFLTAVELVAILLVIGNIIANMFFPPLRRRMRRMVANQARALASAMLAQVRATLREHIEAVDRLAAEASELARLIDQAVITLTLSGGNGADVDRLFGESPLQHPDAAATAQPAMPEGGGEQRTGRRPRFD